MNIYLKLSEIREYNGLSKGAFADSVGIDRSQYSKIENGKLTPTVNQLMEISSIYKVSLDWLIAGKGEMQKKHEDPIHVMKGPAIKKTEETRPRIPMDAAAGSLSVALDGVTLNQCEQLPIIKAFSRYDFTIFARGNSMSPEYQSGDELACIYIKNTSFVQWGRVHVLDTTQGIIVKRIFDAGESILCKSDNDQYSEFNIHKSELYNIALVIGMIRRY